MQRQVLDILTKAGFSFTIQKLDKGKIRIRMNGKESLAKWYVIIGTNNPKHLVKIRKIIAEGGNSSDKKQLVKI
jgi:hypothetical protein